VYMNYEELYEDGEINGDTVFYLDEECTEKYTGHIEYYFNNILIWECDIKEGVRSGVEKHYYEETGELEQINQIENNVGKGISIEYYKNGKIRSISLLVNNLNIDSYEYNEEGQLESKYVYSDERVLGINHLALKEQLIELREKFNLEMINEEIMKYGRIMDEKNLFNR